MQKIKKFLKADNVAFALIAVFVIIFTLLSFGRHDSLKSYLNDLGTYDQVIWNTLHGRFFQMTVSMLDEKNYLGAHFSPILLFFVPFYAILASPKWLLFFQALSAGLGGVPIYWYAKEKLKKAHFALVFLAAYLCYPFLLNGILYDFHEVVFAVSFAAFAFYFMEKENYRLFVFFSVLLALTQEHLVLLVFMMGLCLIFIKGRRKIGAIVSVASLAYFFLVMTVLMPHFSSTGSSALIANNSTYPARYAWLGSSFGEILKNIVTHPVQIVQILLSPDRVNYLFELIIPTFSLALYAWPILILLPLVAINLLSAIPMTFNVYFYHSAVMAPFIFFAAIITFRRWFLGNRLLENIFLTCLLAASVISAFAWSVTPFSTHYSLADYIPDTHAQNIEIVKSLIPSDAVISVQHNLGPHFSERAELYRFPLHYQDAQYVVLDTTDPYRNDPRQLFQFEYALQTSVDDLDAKIEELKKSPDRSLIYDTDGYLVFKKNN